MSAPLLHERYQMQTPLQANKPNVRKAWDRSTRSNVIVKSFLDPYEAQLEFTALSQLDGLNSAVRLLDTYTQDCIGRTEWCIVLEYADYGTLLTLLEQSPNRYLPSDWLVSCTRQLIVGLFDMHSRGVAHGDIKPSNILCRSDGTVAFCDFGMATVANSSSAARTERCSGTPAFIAPEILTIALKTSPPLTSGTNDYDSYAADVWSLGVTLFVIATGVLPFDDPSEMGMYQKIISGRLVFPSKPKLPSKYQSLLRCMLVKNPKHRAGTAELILHPGLS
jgi:serine/threonine protein kinase